MKTVTYKTVSGRVSVPVRIALVSDLHDNDGAKAVERLRKSSPDIIAAAGDITSRIDLNEGQTDVTTGKTVTHKNAFAFLRECAKLAPTFYSLGNHELCGHNYQKNFGHECSAENLELVRESGAILLDNSTAELDGITLCGLTTGMTNPDLTPKLGCIDELERAEGLRVLLCHHPEYFDKYFFDREIDIVLSGHAHGGQIRLFGRGLYAPGQGVFPAQVGGIYSGRFGGSLVVGRGLANTVAVPRLFNPTELVLVDLLPKTKI